MDRAEVVIIGGGVIGASVAWHLAGLGCTDVLLLEREPGLGSGSTGRSVGGIRHQFSSRVNIELSLASVAKFQRFTEETDAPADFVWCGYLFLLDNATDWTQFQANARLQRELGVPDVRTLRPEEVAALAPQLVVDDLVGGTFCGRDGFGDPYAICQGYAQAARRMGGRIRAGVGVTGIDVTGGRVERVQTTEGAVACRWVVDCAGPWAAKVARLAGVTLPIVPLKRTVYITDRFEGLARDCPMTIDFGPSFYFRREGPGVMFGMTNKRQPPGFDLTLDREWLEVTVEQALRRVPVLAEATVMRGWTGLYDTTPDANPIIGGAPEVEGFVVAAGFSGHGFMHSPATGQVVAEMVTGRPTTIDVASLGLERFGQVTGVEHNVI